MTDLSNVEPLGDVQFMEGDAQHILGDARPCVSTGSPIEVGGDFIEVEGDFIEVEGDARPCVSTGSPTVSNSTVSNSTVLPNGEVQPLDFADLKVTYGCKSQVSLVLYALLKSGNIINNRTGKPVTLVDFTRILRQNGVNLDVANLCNRVIVNSRYNKKVLMNFLKQLIYTVEEKVPLSGCK